MLKYPCLILDHDDTVVQSEETVNYPYFCQILQQLRPGTEISLQEYTQGCYQIGFVQMCREKYGFSDQELDIEYQGWKQYIREHIPSPFPGIRQIIARQKAEGGLVCVVSHSIKENILRDYSAHFALHPDEIYGWDFPEQQRKPNPYPLLEIMKKYSLSPDQLLVVDDMKPGWEMARSAQVPIAFAGWGRKNYPQIYTEMSELCDITMETTGDLYRYLFEE